MAPLAVKFTTGVNFSGLDFSLGRQGTWTRAIVEFSCAIIAPSSDHLGVESLIKTAKQFT